MRSLPNASLSILASPFSPATAAKIMQAIIGLLVIVTFLYYASPMRLTRLMGLLTEDVSKLHKLQLEVCAFRAQTLVDSLSWRAAICEFFKGRSFTLYCCINAVRNLETHIRWDSDFEIGTGYNRILPQSCSLANPTVNLTNKNNDSQI
ncbi:hypothetical protein B0H16DRAFT_1456958 [Mycena metata]|uniref:Uncharacterized protein n=1 Tax=Mycena metata TaxID=1033252 RepID=A0AAD7JBQ5_9AGAR|nr:hypothetical protein B0H16DRAFT_1456958 [Mycena metata]